MHGSMNVEFKEECLIMKKKAPRFLESSETKRLNLPEDLTEYFHHTAVAYWGSWRHAGVRETTTTPTCISLLLLDYPARESYCQD